jgi:hypothetical protein
VQRLLSGIVLPVLGLVLLGAVVAPSLATAPLPEPSGRVILTVTGAIQHAGKGGRAQFDRKMLEALGTTTVTTSTSWTDGATVFEGVLARDVLRAVGAQGGTVTAVALNDYKIDIPVQDFARYRVLFALKMDGVTLSPRDKGPIWIVYPRDDHRELRTESVDAKWIWQLARLEIR